MAPCPRRCSATERRIHCRSHRPARIQQRAHRLEQFVPARGQESNRSSRKRDAAAAASPGPASSSRLALTASVLIRAPWSEHTLVAWIRQGHGPALPSKAPRLIRLIRFVPGVPPHILLRAPVVVVVAHEVAVCLGFVRPVGCAEHGQEILVRGQVGEMGEMRSVDREADDGSGSNLVGELVGAVQEPV